MHAIVLTFYAGTLASELNHSAVLFYSLQA